jgi:hypothetical protein
MDTNTHITVLFDGHPAPDHFLYDQQHKYTIINTVSGNDGLSFLNLVNYVAEQTIASDDIIYILEDDYAHVQGWPDVLREGIELIKADYVTLYDHPDKYFDAVYGQLRSQILCGPRAHWRTTPSTTNTYASLYKTFIKDIGIHREYCDLSIGFTRDHDKFLKLWEKGSTLISSIPAFSTHCEIPYLSPLIDWSNHII